MSKGAKLGIVVLAIGIVLIVVARWIVPSAMDNFDRSTSDAAGTKGTVTVRVDNWVGYWPLCSDRMKRDIRNSGYLLQCEDDQADYAGRMEALADGDIDLAVATVDSYILNAEPFRFPGAIVAVTDESQGGDAILAYKDAVPNLEALKSASGIKIAYTPDSPSDHLKKTAGSHFDIPILRETPSEARIETMGSEGALESFRKKEANVAILWEPDVSRALEIDGVVKLLGTESTTRVIVDILVANRDFISENREVVNLVLSSYFRVLKYYRDRPDELLEDIRDDTDLSIEQVRNMLDGVSWVNLTENCSQWFGITSGSGSFTDNGLVQTIESTVDILMDSGDFDRYPIPDEDPYRITNRSFVETLCRDGVRSGFNTAGAVASDVAISSLEARFTALDDASWSALQEVGTMKVEPINFRSGTGALTLDGKRELDVIIERLSHYPTFRVLVKGHTGVRGDPEANLRLSQERADSVVRYLQVTYGVDPNRIRAIGFGGNEPLSRLPGESDRAFGYRLPRVEVYLLQEIY